VGRAEGHAVGWRAARRALGATQLRAMCERRDSQLDGPNAPGRAAREERAATSVRRVGDEAALRALAIAGVVAQCEESSARSVASAAARFAGRGPFLTLRHCEGERGAFYELSLLLFVIFELLARSA
jgi:hypothetical protein